mmetsp:Transcript_14402/g.56656  ORF Transcript_14402/g.56656 Transcript_14402/m.56656 type:complete len:202 (+) Transcript_14402:149-754(+)
MSAWPRREDDSSATAVASLHDLEHGHEEVDRVDVDAEAVVDGVELLLVAGVAHHLLRVVEDKEAEHSRAAIYRNVVEQRRGGEPHAAQARRQHNAESDRSRTAVRKEGVVRRRRAHQRQSAHDSAGGSSSLHDNRSSHESDGAQASTHDATEGGPRQVLRNRHLVGDGAGNDLCADHADEREAHEGPLIHAGDAVGGARHE